MESGGLLLEQDGGCSCVVLLSIDKDTRYARVCEMIKEAWWDRHCTLLFGPPGEKLP